MHNSMPADMSYVQQYTYRMIKPCLFASTAQFPESSIYKLFSLKDERSFSSYPPVFAAIGTILIDTNMASI